MTKDGYVSTDIRDESTTLIIFGNKIRRHFGMIISRRHRETDGVGLGHFGDDVCRGIEGLVALLLFWIVAAVADADEGDVAGAHNSVAFGIRVVIVVVELVERRAKCIAANDPDLGDQESGEGEDELDDGGEGLEDAARPADFRGVPNGLDVDALSDEITDEVIVAEGVVPGTERREGQDTTDEKHCRKCDFDPS